MSEQIGKNMETGEIIARIKALNLPEGSYVVFGGAPLAIWGIRGARDIDLLVSETLFQELKGSGWQELNKGPGDVPLTHDIFEAHENWNHSPYSPTLQQLLASATFVDGVPFASLEEVRKWKAASGRPKDLTDIKLIDAYLEKTQEVS